MPVVSCSICGAQNKYPDDPRFAGQRVACGNCKSQIVIPKAAAGQMPQVTQAPRPPVPMVPVPPPRPAERPFEVPNEADPVPPRAVQNRPPVPPPLPGPAPQGGSAAIAFLMLLPAWCGALLALPLGLKYEKPLLALILASAGLGVGTLSLLFALIRGGKGWGIGSLAAVLAASSAVFGSLSLPKAEAAPREDKDSVKGDHGSILANTTWVMPDPSKHPQTVSVLSAHPGHIVVLVGEVGTDRAEVGVLLGKLFPNRVIEIPRNDSAQKALLAKQLKESIDSIKNPEAVLKVLTDMVAAGARFKGYVAGDAKTTFEIMINRNGVFSLGRDASTQKHGALLHARGIDQLAEFTGVKDTTSLEYLSALRDAIRDYSSLYDALAVAGNRPAYLIKVEPTVAAHEEAIGTLLNHVGKPVFVPRPPPRLFDAVDPADVGGGGRGDYELQLPLPYYWRQVGQADRDGADLKALPEGSKWARFEANRKVTWKQLTVENNRGAVLVASFDVAVQLSGHVVLFRNQNLYLHANRDVVVKQTNNAVNKMGISVPQGDDVASIQRGSDPSDPWVGTLNYTALANSFAEKKMPSAGNVSMLTNAEFAALRKTEGEK